jgi:hypothetical protein
MGIFGPNRNDPLGITPVPGQAPPQFLEFVAESAVVHSKSQGWLPAVVIRAVTDDNAGIAGFIALGPGNEDKHQELARSIIEAGRRAKLDLKVATSRGQVPPSSEMDGQGHLP